MASEESLTRVQALSPSDRGMNVCLVANLRPIKRIEDLIEAAARLCKPYPEGRFWQFWIVGETLDTAYAARLRTRVKDLDLAHCVHFLGASGDPIAIMRQCALGVLCSESEGLSNTLLEYMSCGLGCVCSDVGGNAELIEGGVTGLLYACGDIDALARCLLDLAKDSDKRAALGAAAQRRVGVFSVAAMAEAHQRVYTDPFKARSLAAAKRAS